MSFRLNRENMQGVKWSRLRLSAVGLAILLGAVVAQAQTPAKDATSAVSVADSVVVPAELQLLVRQALERHPDVLMSEAQSQAAYSQAKEARSQLGPAISVGSSVATQRQSLRTGDISNSYQPLYAYVRLSLPLFDPGLKAQSAQREQAAVGADWRWVGRREELMLDVLDAYVELQKSTRLLAISQANLKMHREYLDLVKTIVRRDLGRASDVSTAAARVALAEAVNINRLAQLEKSRLTFQSLVGFSAIDVRPELPKIVPAQSLDQAYQLAMKNSPVIQVAQADLSVARLGIAVARAPYQPKVSLDATVKHGSDWGGVKGVQSDVYVGVQAEWRLWSAGGGAQAADKAAVANEAASRFALDKIRADLQRQVGVFWFDFVSGNEVTRSYAEYVENARASAEATRQQFRVGRRSLIDVLNAENERFTAESNWVTAQLDLVRASYRLLGIQGQLPGILGL
jgi:adhesin transport system outer membrane protein